MIRTVRPAAALAALLAATAAPPAAGQDAAAPVPPMPPPTGLLDLGLTQEAWTNPKANQAPGQSRPGYRAYRFSWASTYKVALRTGVPTSLRIDPTEQVRHVINGNPHVFEHALMAPNLLEVRPLFAGVDTALKLLTYSGRLYSYYIRSYPPDWSEITDHIVDVVLDPGSPLHLNPHGPHTQHQTDRSAALGHALPALDPALQPAATAPRTPATPISPPANPAFAHVDTAAFDPGAIRWDNIRVRANTPAAAAAIGPVRVYRTDTHTYIDFGDKARRMQQWPTVMLLDSAAEAIVNTHTVGRDRHVLVVDAVGSMVLAAGQHIICIDLIEAPAPAPAPTAASVTAAARFPADAPVTIPQQAPAQPDTDTPSEPAPTPPPAAAPEPENVPTSGLPATSTPAQPTATPAPDNPPSTSSVATAGQAAEPASTAATPAAPETAQPPPAAAVLTIFAQPAAAARTRAVAEALLGDFLDPPFPPLAASPDGSELAVAPLPYPAAVRLCARLNTKSFSCRVTRQDPVP